MKFYKKIVHKKDMSPIDLNDHFKDISVPKLSDDEKFSLELAEALKNMKMRKVGALMV